MKIDSYFSGFILVVAGLGALAILGLLAVQEDAPLERPLFVPWTSGATSLSVVGTLYAVDPRLIVSTRWEFPAGPAW